MFPEAVLSTRSIHTRKRDLKKKKLKQKRRGTFALRNHGFSTIPQMQFYLSNGTLFWALIILISFIFKNSRVKFSLSELVLASKVSWSNNFSDIDLQQKLQKMRSNRINGSLRPSDEAMPRNGRIHPSKARFPNQAERERNHRILRRRK